MLATKNYICRQCKKRMKSTSRLTRYLNTCTSLLLHIQPNCNSQMLVEDDNALDYFMHYKEEEYP